jgi:hypothetical protein
MNWWLMKSDKRPHLILRPAVVDMDNLINPHRIWITQKGEEIHIEDLTDEHIEGILEKMDREPRFRPKWRSPILEEKKRRLAEKTTAGRILYGKDAK